MVRLFHDAALDGAVFFLPGADATPAPVRVPPPVVAEWAAVPYWSIAQPSRYFFEETAQEHWGLDDFTDLRLPAPVVLLEAPLSRRTKSAVVGTRHYDVTRDERYGALLSTHTVPPGGAGSLTAAGAMPGDRLLSAALMQGRRGEYVLSPAAQIVLRLDPSGRPVLWPNGNETLLAPAPAHVPGGAEAAARPEFAAALVDTLAMALWPACLVVDAVNAGRAATAELKLPAARRRELLRRTGHAWRAPVAVTITPPARPGCARPGRAGRTTRYYAGPRGIARAPRVPRGAPRGPPLARLAEAARLASVRVRSGGAFRAATGAARPTGTGGAGWAARAGTHE